MKRTRITEPKRTQNWSKHKKLFISAPERARTVLNAVLECMYFDKMDGRRPYKRRPYYGRVDGG